MSLKHIYHNFYILIRYSMYAMVITRIGMNNFTTYAFRCLTKEECCHFSNFFW
jgi:hypothetical protein